MPGFFNWDFDKLQAIHKDTAVKCPNCGSSVRAAGVTNHVCEEDEVLVHHLKLLHEGFSKTTRIRSHTPDDDFDAEPLLTWNEFNKWCETDHGQFEIEYARRTRP